MSQAAFTRGGVAKPILSDVGSKGFDLLASKKICSSVSLGAGIFLVKSSTYKGNSETLNSERFSL